MNFVPASNTTAWTIANGLWQASAILDDSLHPLGGANLPWSARIDYTVPWTYSFGLLFLKRLSDRFEEKAEALMAEGVSERVAWTNPDEHQVFVPDQARWGTIQKQTTHIGETLNAASAALEEQNRAFEGILTSIDYTDESKLGYARESVLADMIRCCSEVSFRNDRMADPDPLSDAYEDLLEWSPTTRPARRPACSTRRGGRL